MKIVHNGKLNGPRYVTKFVNGIWTIFDRWEFKNCEPNLGTKKAALKLLGRTS